MTHVTIGAPRGGHAKSMGGGTDRTRDRARRRRRAVIVGGLFVVAVVIPAAWVIGIWAVGPALNHAELSFITPLLFVVLLIGMPASLWVAARVVLRLETRLAARAGIDRGFRYRSPSLRSIRPPLLVLEDEAPRLDTRRRAGALLLVAVMFAGGLTLLVGAPLASVWGVSQLSASTQPTMGAYVLVLVGVCVSMGFGVRVLALLQVVYGRVVAQGAQARGRPRSGWLKSYTDERGVRRAGRGLETAMVAIVIVASLALAFWFVVLAGPSSYIAQPLGK